MTEGGKGVWQKMTDDDDEAGGRREKKHSTLRHTNHDNLGVKVQPFPSEAYKIAPRSKIAMTGKGATYKIVFHRYVIRPFINYVIWVRGRWVGQKMTQDDKGEGVKGLEWPEKDGIINEQPLKRILGPLKILGP